MRTTPTSRGTSPPARSPPTGKLTESGAGAWWGGFVDGRLVASLGIFAASEGLAQFQAVKTHTEFRNQGLAGALVVAASRYAAAKLGARQLVMAADPSYSAIRVYRAVGFTEGGTHLEATLAPERKSSAAAPRCWSPPAACWRRGAAAREESPPASSSSPGSESPTEAPEAPSVAVDAGPGRRDGRPRRRGVGRQRRGGVALPDPCLRVGARARRRRPGPAAARRRRRTSSCG